MRRPACTRRTPAPGRVAITMDGSRYVRAMTWTGMRAAALEPRDPLAATLSSSQIRVQLFVRDQDAIEQAREVAVVADGVVHRSAVVPERHRARSPREAHLVLRV